jgi:hypothetical protein
MSSTEGLGGGAARPPTTASPRGSSGLITLPADAELVRGLRFRLPSRLADVHRLYVDVVSNGFCALTTQPTSAPLPGGELPVDVRRRFRLPSGAYGQRFNGRPTDLTLVLVSAHAPANAGPILLLALRTVITSLGLAVQPSGSPTQACPPPRQGQHPAAPLLLGPAP